MIVLSFSAVYICTIRLSADLEEVGWLVHPSLANELNWQRLGTSDHLLCTDLALKVVFVTGWEEDFTLNVMCAALVGKSIEHVVQVGRRTLHWMWCVQHWLGKVCIGYVVQVGRRTLHWMWRAAQVGKSLHWTCSTGWEEDFTLNVVCAAQVGKSLHWIWCM